jgi:heat-inducible transcriptional repressor
MQSGEGLTERQFRILEAVIQIYVETAQPAGSQAAARRSRLGISPASVRSTMGELETKGYLFHAHTSGGRIPTDRGYRFYVDLLLDTKRPNRSTTAVEARLRRESPNGLLDSLLPQVSHMLSQASRGVGFAVRPAHEAAVFDRVEFVPLSALRVLVVIVASGGHVIQKVIDLGEPLGADDLRQAANYLNEEFSGLPLHRAREAVLERINAERSLYDALRDRALRLATSTFSDLPDDRPMYVEGASSLLDDATGLTVQTLQALLQMIDEKQKLLALLNEYIDGPGLTVVIGAEHLDPSLRPFSLVLSTYDDGSGIGTVGVIGPTRMHYSRAIAAVDGAAQAVSRLLRDPN